MQNMAFVVIILNFLFPFSLGTFVFMCCYPNKEKKDIVHAFWQIGSTIITYGMFIIVLTSPAHDYDGNTDTFTMMLIICFLFFTISYIWGLVFGGMLLYKVRSLPIHLRMPFPLNANIHQVNVHQYQPLPQ
jgi:hypothetical protein